MKTKRFFITTLLVVAAASVAVVSCKKETLNTLSNNTSQSVKTFTVPQVDDMNAYLKDFKQKMQTATRDEEDFLLNGL
jgi:curli biogenesis system outer membrane secretion channel CsgG